MRRYINKSKLKILFPLLVIIIFLVLILEAIKPPMDKVVKVKFAQFKFYLIASEESSMPLSVLYSKQKTKYPYKKYQDRKEGIIKKINRQSGLTKIELVSALIESPDSVLNNNVSELHLGFYLPVDSRAKIVIDEFQKLYRMELLQRNFTSGLFSFSWSSEIARYYKISPQNLSPSALVLPIGYKKIIPVVIYGSIPKEIQIKYRFIIFPCDAVKILKYSIYPSNSFKLIHSGILRNLEAEKFNNQISWNGSVQENQRVPNGEYDLVLETVFEILPGVTSDTVTSKYHFYHYNEIFKKLAESGKSP